MESNRLNENNKQRNFRAMLDQYILAEPSCKGEQPSPALYSSDEIFRYIRPEEAQQCIEMLCSTLQTTASFRAVLEDLEVRLVASRTNPHVFRRFQARTAQLAARYLVDAAPLARTAACYQDRAERLLDRHTGR